MTATPLWYVGDRDPSIQDQLTIDGAPVNLSASAVQFKMRQVGSSALKVNQPVSFKDATGNWRYDWGATDLDTAGQYLVWVEVTTGGRKQTLFESLIEVAEHANAHVYLELEQFKGSLELRSNERFADLDAQRALRAASRGIDRTCNRRFWQDADALQVRYFEPVSARLVRIDDLVTLTSVATDSNSEGTYDTAWTLGSDFELAPFNAPADRRPYETLRRLGGSRYWFTSGGWAGERARSVKVTGRFGWPAVPDEIEQATQLLAHRLLVRSRQAPLGILGFEETAMRLARTDPDVAPLIAPYMRGTMAVA